MSGRIINKKQYIAVRAYWMRGGPGPACTISINGIGVGTYTCPVAAMNNCTNTSSSAGLSMVERLNSPSAPPTNNNTTIVRGNVPACYMTTLPGRAAFSTKQVGTFSGLNFLNATSDGKVTVVFSWASSAMWPNCCTRANNSDTSTYSCGWGGAVLFDISYLWTDGSLDNAVSATYTSLVTWSFSNLRNFLSGCPDTSQRSRRMGGYDVFGNLCVGSCDSTAPGNPDLTTIVIPCPSC